MDEDQRQTFEEQLMGQMDALYNLALALTRNKTEAEDLVQDTALRAFRYYHQFEPGSNFKAWILTIMRNHFINNYRKKTREPFHVDYDTVAFGVAAPEISGAAEEIFGERIQNALDDLPEELRTVVTLFYVEDLSYKEIAVVMKCPIGTVMSRLYTARQMLKNQLAQIIAKEGV